MLNIIKRFNDNEEGSVFVLVALSSLMLIAAAGAAIDMARAQTLQQKISSSLDAAGLAAGATASSVDPTTQATRYFNANFPSGYLGAGTITVNTTCADLNGSSVTCTSPSTYTINLTATTSQATTFMKAVGITSISVGASSQITRQTSGMELALVLDNTGSMQNAVASGESAKIDALQCAVAGAEITKTAIGQKTCSAEGLVTSGLLDILYGSSTTLPDLYVGVVPFSDMVKMGVTSAPGSNFVNNVTSSNKSSMGGCIDSRNPTTASTSDSGLTLPSGDILHLDISDDPPSTSYFTALTSSGNSECPRATVQPMTTNKTTAVSAIQTMYPNGSTLLNIGLTWGWRMLSPNWTGVWGNSPTFTYPGTTNTVDLPLPYNTTHMLKVVVFMTDGINSNGSGSNTSNVTGSSNSDNAYEKQSYEPSNTGLDQLTEDVCDAMKANGIIIYTIGFGQTDPHTPPTVTDRTTSNTYVDVPLLEYCATQEYTGDTSSHFFLAPTNAQLEAAFQQIGDQLANLRVSQ